MRRIKFLFFFFLFFILSSFCFADSKLLFSVESDYGILNGLIQEFVLYENSDDSLCTLSRLDWDVSKIKYFGNVFSYLYNDSIYLSIGYRAGTTQKSGLMQDSDWQDESCPTFRTNYSVHDNELSSYYKFSMNAGYKFSFPIHIALTPIISWDTENYCFLASDGYFDYTNDIYDGRKGTFTGPCISYSQYYSCCRLGLILATDKLNHFEAGISAFFSPGFWMNGYDDHLVRKPVMHWLDAMEKGFMLQGDSFMNFIFNEHYKLGISGGIQYIPLMHGKSYQQSGIFWFPISSYGGGKRTLWNISASYTFTL